MTLCKPNHRAEAVKTGNTETELEQEYKKFLDGDTDNISSSLQHAHEIYSDPYKKEVLEAFILSGATTDEISTSLRLNTEVIEIYKYLFFDTSVFRDELEIESYVHTYPDEYGKKLKINAITIGKDYLFFRFSRGKKDLDLDLALKSMVETAFMLSKATKLNPLDSSVSKEARQWAQLAGKLIETYYKVTGGKDSKQGELKIVLEEIDSITKTLISKEDILS